MVVVGKVVGLVRKDEEKEVGVGRMDEERLDAHDEVEVEAIQAAIEWKIQEKRQETGQWMGMGWWELEGGRGEHGGQVNEDQDEEREMVHHWKQEVDVLAVLVALLVVGTAVGQRVGLGGSDLC